MFGPCLMGTISLGLSVAGSLWCRTFEMELTNTVPYANSGSIPKFETGIFLHRDTDFIVTDNALSLIVEPQDTCISYSEDAWNDPQWKTAALTQLASWFIAAILVINLFFAAFCPCGVWYYRGMGACFGLVVTILDGMIFLAMESALCSGSNPHLQEEVDTSIYSPQSCTFGTTAWFVVGSLIGYSITGGLCFWLGLSSDRASETRKEESCAGDMDKTSIADEDAAEKKSVFSRVFFCFRTKTTDDSVNDVVDRGDEEKQNDTFTGDEINGDVAGLGASDIDNIKVENIAADDEGGDFASNRDEGADDEHSGKIDESVAEEDWLPFNESVEVDVGSSSEQLHILGTFGKVDGTTDEH